MRISTGSFGGLTFGAMLHGYIDDGKIEGFGWLIRGRVSGVFKEEKEHTCCGQLY